MLDSQRKGMFSFRFGLWMSLGGQFGLSLSKQYKVLTKSVPQSCADVHSVISVALDVPHQ